MTNEQICEAFMKSGTEEFYRNKHSNMSYNNSLLYSYNSILANKYYKNIMLINHTTATCSNTSIKQAHVLKSVIPSHYKVFEYDFDKPACQWYLDKCTNLADKSKRARVKKEFYREQLNKCATEALEYIDIIEEGKCDKQILTALEQFKWVSQKLN